MFSKAIEWQKIHDHPMKKVKQLKVDNRRTRILTDDEQAALLAACPKLARIVKLALITGARIGELVALTWANVTEGELVFRETKSGGMRRLPMSPATRAVLADMKNRRCQTGIACFQEHANAEALHRERPRAHVRRAVVRAGITTGDVSLHTCRHTALSRMVAAGASDHTVKAISGHSTTRMLERYTHPTDALKVAALETFALGGTTLAPPNSVTDGQKSGQNEKRAA